MRTHRLTTKIIDEMLDRGWSAEAMAHEVKRLLAADQADAERSVLTGEDARSPRPEVRQAVIARDGFTCRYCGCDVDVPHLDHVIPFSRGGKTTIENLVVSCRSCNASKKDRDLSGWRRP